MVKFKTIKNNIKDNFVEYLLYVFVFLLPWQARWIARDFFIDGSVFEYGRINLYAFDIVLLFLLIGYFLKSGFKIQKLKFKVNILSGLLLFVVYGLLSIGWADDKLISLYWGVRLLAGFGLFYLIQKINFSKMRLAMVLVMAGAIQGLLAIQQFLDQQVWGSKWLGMAMQKAQILGVSVVEFGIERWLRAYGSWPHPNILGAWLILSFIGVIYLVPKIQDKYHKLFLIFSSSFIWLGIFFSFSRGAWIVFILIYILGLIYIWQKSQAWIKKFAGILWVYGLILLTVFIIAALPIVKTRLNIGPPARLEVKSNTQRLDGYRQAGEIIQANWLAGVGLGNYVFELQNKYPDLEAWDIGAVHNVYLLIMSELGLIGFIWLLLLNLYIFISLIKRKRWPYAGLLLSLYSLLLFDHFWWTLAAGLYMFWLVMGLAAKEVKN